MDLGEEEEVVDPLRDLQGVRQNALRLDVLPPGHQSLPEPHQRVRLTAGVALAAHDPQHPVVRLLGGLEAALLHIGGGQPVERLGGAPGLAQRGGDPHGLQREPYRRVRVPPLQLDLGHLVQGVRLGGRVAHHPEGVACLVEPAHRRPETALHPVGDRHIAQRQRAPVHLPHAVEELEGPVEERHGGVEALLEHLHGGEFVAHRRLTADVPRVPVRLQRPLADGPPVVVVVARLEEHHTGHRQVPGELLHPQRAGLEDRGHQGRALGLEPVER